MYVPVYVCMKICMYLRIYICVFMNLLCTSIYIYIGVYYLRICVCIYIYMHVCTCVCLYERMYVYTYVCEVLTWLKLHCPPISQAALYLLITLAWLLQPDFDRHIEYIHEGDLRIFPRKLGPSASFVQAYLKSFLDLS
jgi:hypothetical protein